MLHDDEQLKQMIEDSDATADARVSRDIRIARAVEEATLAHPKAIPVDGLGQLLCPNCQSEYLRHDRVDIFERGEDAPTGLHVTVDSKHATVDTSLGGNPSTRRAGLAVSFWCEICHARSALTLAQHKGNTLIELKVTEKPA